jgi:hypothetical protein
MHVHRARVRRIKSSEGAPPPKAIATVETKQAGSAIGNWSCLALLILHQRRSPLRATPTDVALDRNRFAFTEPNSLHLASALRCQNTMTPARSAAVIAVLIQSAVGRVATFRSTATSISPRSVPQVRHTTIAVQYHGWVRPKRYPSDSAATKTGAPIPRVNARYIPRLHSEVPRLIAEVAPRRGESHRPRPRQGSLTVWPNSPNPPGADAGRRFDNGE